MEANYFRYGETELKTSNPMKIILLLYDGAITFLKRSIEYAEKGDIKNKNIYANKARDIIVELNNSLNLEAGGEIARGLRRLYFFMDRHLMQASWNNDLKGLKDVAKLLASLREAWEDVYRQSPQIGSPDVTASRGITI